MPIEFETKILDIDVESIRKKLNALGAHAVPEVLQRRWIFDIKPETHEWIRLRDNGHKSTITYKRKDGSGIGQTEELEVDVGDFETAYDILSKIHFREVIYQESRRIQFILGEFEFNIDTWPLIPPYLEIESTSERKVREGLRLLGLAGKDAGNISVNEIYRSHGIELHSYKQLRFE